jgi:hypothetical protein
MDTAASTGKADDRRSKIYLGHSVSRMQREAGTSLIPVVTVCLWGSHERKAEFEES